MNEKLTVMYKIFHKSDDIASNYSVNIGYDDSQLYERYNYLIDVILKTIKIFSFFFNDSDDQDFKISSTEKVTYSEEARW
jgi:hypothetical protein